MTQRMASAYRTMSNKPVIVVARIVPIHHVIERTQVKQLKKGGTATVAAKEKARSITYTR